MVLLPVRRCSCGLALLCRPSYRVACVQTLHTHASLRCKCTTCRSANLAVCPAAAASQALLTLQNGQLQRLQSGTVLTAGWWRMQTPLVLQEVRVVYCDAWDVTWLQTHMQASAVASKVPANFWEIARGPCKEGGDPSDAAGAFRLVSAAWCKRVHKHSHAPNMYRQPACAGKTCTCHIVETK